MPFPEGWNQNIQIVPLGPRPTTAAQAVLNAFFSGVTTGNFADNVRLWVDIPGALLRPITPAPFDPYNPNVPAAPKTLVWCRHVKVTNDGLGIIEVGFHTTDVDIRISDVLLPGERVIYTDRIVAGIALRTQPASVNSAFRVAAW